MKPALEDGQDPTADKKIIFLGLNINLSHFTRIFVNLEGMGMITTLILCAALSLQSRHHRAEHWMVVLGTAEVEIEGKFQFVSENQSVFIPSAQGTV